MLEQVGFFPRSARIIGAKIANIRAEQAVMLGECLGQEANAITQWNAIC